MQKNDRLAVHLHAVRRAVKTVNVVGTGAVMVQTHYFFVVSHYHR